MVESLYDTQFRYTSQALDIGAEVYSALYPIFTRYARQFSPRELSLLMMAEVSSLEANVILNSHFDSKTEPTT
jgi:hypothetical protein